MPQTKKKSTKQKSRNKSKANASVSKVYKKEANEISVNDTESLLLENIRASTEARILELSLKLPRFLRNKTLTELKDLPYDGNGDSTTLKSTISKSILKSTHKNTSRSHSVESSSSSSTLSTTKTSRLRSSRSVSRNRREITDNFTTPMCPLKSYNNIKTVTPKIKSNIPQVLLRRPKQGEIAISMQGSPLMVSGVVSDDTANVNIPLCDGRVLSIQPRKGLRMSTLPSLDEEMQRQIKVLHDNLKTVCEMIDK